MKYIHVTPCFHVDCVDLDCTLTDSISVTPDKATQVISYDLQGGRLVTAMCHQAFLLYLFVASVILVSNYLSNQGTAFKTS